LEWAPLLWAEGGEEWRVQQKEERRVRTEPIPRYWHVPNAGRIRARNAESFVASRNEEVEFNISNDSPSQPTGKSGPKVRQVASRKDPRSDPNGFLRQVPAVQEAGR